MKRFFSLLFSLATLSAFGVGNVVPVWYSSTNELHVSISIGTNLLFVAGAGDATVNGNYPIRDTVGGITVWTNVNGLAGIGFDPGLHAFANEATITNSAGTVLYDSGGAAQITGLTWNIQGGAGPAPSVVVGTNSITNSVLAIIPTPSFQVPGNLLGTNFYFVNSAIGNDTNGVAGRRDRPYQNFTNVVFYYATHTNDVIYLEPGTNYFGEFDIQVSNGVSIIGLGPRDQCWIDKAASKVDVSDVSLKPGHGSTFANFSGNVSLQFGKNNVSLIGLHTIGLIDNLLSAGSSNLVADSCFFEVNASGALGAPLIDAGVISGANFCTIKNCIFSSRRRGNGAVTQRGLVIKGGTNLVVGCTFICTDSTNNTANTFGCIGVAVEGGNTIFSGCAALVYNTNANNSCAFTNSGDTDVAYNFPATVVVSNGVAWWPGHVIRTNFIGGQLYTNVYSMPINVSASGTGVVAAVAGAMKLELWCYTSLGAANVTGFTNKWGQQTTASTVAGTNMSYLSGEIPPNYVWTFTNQSGGAGNAANAFGGQIRF